MQKLLIAVMTLVLVVLAACAPATLQAQPLNKTALDKCANVQCGENAYCEVGACLCSGSFKKCGEKCIGERACCTTEDCSPGRTCQGGACVERPKCEYLATWDPIRDECSCVEDAKYCPAQGKCIPADHCCGHEDCDDDERCPPTTYSGTICMKLDTKKCRIVHEGTVLDYFFSQGEYQVRLVNVLENQIFDVKVNNDTARRMSLNETLTVDNKAQLFVENFEVFGGNCKEDVED